MGLFEQTKHVAREIAEENLRRLSGEGRLPPQADAQSRQRLLGCEQLRRELVVNRQEKEASERIARTREAELLREAEHWRQNAAFALSRDNDELSDKANERAASYERDAELARNEARAHASHVARLTAEIAELDRRIEAERALRLGKTPPPCESTVATSGPPTRSLGVVKDPLAEAFAKLRREPPAT